MPKVYLRDEFFVAILSTNTTDNRSASFANFKKGEWFTFILNVNNSIELYENGVIKSNIISSAMN
jgi:hypothetical protein